MHPFETKSGSKVIVDQKEYTSFAGTNYLGLSQNKTLWGGLEDTFSNLGFSAGGSRITTGDNPIYSLVEREVAKLFGSEDACLVSAGYLSNLLAIETITPFVDIWYIDEKCHPSFLLGIEKSKIQTYKHLDTENLASLIHENGSTRYCVLSDAVFSMYGEVCPIEAIIDKIDLDGNFLILDEAHSVGVVGENGEGILSKDSSYARCENIIRTGTFSKSFGVFGGYALMSNRLSALARKNTNAYKACTPLPAVLCKAIQNSIDLFKQGGLQKKLHENCQIMSEILAEVGVNHHFGKTPIFYLNYGFSKVTPKNLHKIFHDNGIIVPIMEGYPGCPEGGLLRWTVSALHEPQDFNDFGQILKSYW